MSSKSELAKRMLNYRNILLKLKNLGIIKVFSDNIADATGLSSSQVRKDFIVLDIKGNKKGGYQIDYLIDKLESILGCNREDKVIIAGYGNIGKAIIAYKHFSIDNFNVVAAFDIDKDLINTQSEVPIYPIDHLEDFISKNNIRVGIIAVPENAATEIYERMCKAGIKGVLNFARVFLRETEETIVKTINIELQIENLIYLVNIDEQDSTKKISKTVAKN